MISANAYLSEQSKIVVLMGARVPSSTTPDFVSMKGFNRCCVVIPVRNTTATVAGSAITLTQATNVGNGSGKTLAFTTAYRCLNTGAGGNGDALVSFAVSSNTFTTDGTASTENLYVIEINETDLDVANGFDCIRVNAADSTNATLSITAMLYPCKYGKTSLGSAIID